MEKFTPKFFVATALLFDADDKLLIYLRDDNPEISFPNCWDLFGGIIEQDESAAQCLFREVLEELGIAISDFTFWKSFDCDLNDGRPNRKFVFIAHTDHTPDKLKLDVGQKLISIDLAERKNFRFANMLGDVIEEYAATLH